MEQKRGEGKQRFKKQGGESKLDQGVGASRKGEGLEPLYELCLDNTGIGVYWLDCAA